MCSVQAEACLDTPNPVSSVPPLLLLTANSIVSPFASLYGPLSAFCGGNYLYGQCQLIIDLVITRFPLRLGQLIYKASAKGEVSYSVIHDLWLI